MGIYALTGLEFLILLVVSSISRSSTRPAVHPPRRLLGARRRDRRARLLLQIVRSCARTCGLGAAARGTQTSRAQDLGQIRLCTYILVTVPLLLFLLFHDVAGRATADRHRRRRARLPGRDDRQVRRGGTWSQFWPRSPRSSLSPCRCSASSTRWSRSPPAVRRHLALELPSLRGGSWRDGQCRDRGRCCRSLAPELPLPGAPAGPLYAATAPFRDPGQERWTFADIAVQQGSVGHPNVAISPAGEPGHRGCIGRPGPGGGAPADPRTAASTAPAGAGSPARPARRRLAHCPHRPRLRTRPLSVALRRPPRRSRRSVLGPAECLPMTEVTFHA